VLQCVAVCCSVLQCVAECCGVLQCVAACCRKHLAYSQDGAEVRQMCYKRLTNETYIHQKRPAKETYTLFETKVCALRYHKMSKKTSIHTHRVFPKI